MARSRNRNRQPGFQPNAQPTAPTAYRVDRSKMLGSDILLFMQGRSIDENDHAAVGEYLAQLLPALDRLVVGGVLHLPIDKIMTDVLPAVSAAMQAMGNPKN